MEPRPHPAITPVQQRLVRVLPLLAAGCAIVFGVLLLDVQRRTQATAREAARYSYASEGLSRALLHLKDIESNQRGYTLTGDEEFLVGLQESGARVRAELDSLGALVTTPAEAELFRGLQDLALRRLEVGNAVVEARRTHGLAAAAELAATSEGRALMDDFSSRMDAIIGAVGRLRTVQEAEQRDRAARITWIILAGSLASAAAAFGSSSVLARLARSQHAAAVALGAANERLTEQAVELEAQATDLEQASADLRENQELFRALVENAFDMILVARRDWTVTYASTSAQRMLGYSPAELFEVALTDLIHPDDVKAWERGFAAIAEHAGATTAWELRFRHADGGWRMLHGRWTNLLDDRRIDGVVINCRDATEQRSLEQQFRQAQKMDAVGRLAGGIAHDFNNLLTTMRGFAQFARETIGADHGAREDLDEVLKAADVASSVTKQLLAFSRQQVMRPEVLNLNDVVIDSGRLLRRLLGAPIRFESTLDPELWPIEVDAGQIRQVIMNLAVNARDAMPDGGVLSVETRNVVMSEEYAAQRISIEPGPYVVLSITDTGVGIPADVRDRIFEPFFTTKEPGKGTGLGLSTTHGIVSQLGGDIWVYSEPGRGSTFKVHLPASPGTAQPVAPVRYETREPAPAHGTVLIVEDDEAVRRFSARALAAAGYRVLEADSGEAALHVLDEHGAAIALVMTDMTMPGLSGAALGRHVETVHPGIQLLYTSGYPRGEIAGRSELSPHVEFIEKPFTVEALLQRVRAVLQPAGAGPSERGT